MKKLAIIFSLIIFTSICFACLSSRDTLLTKKDFEYTLENNLRPAISIPDTGKKYFNEWHCLLGESITITTSQIDYDGIKQSPTLYAKYNGRDVEYATDPDINWDVTKMMDHWHKIIKKSDQVCIFSVYLQNTPEGELRYIERIKTEAGIWDRNDDWFVIMQN